MLSAILAAAGALKGLADTGNSIAQPIFNRRLTREQNQLNREQQLNIQKIGQDFQEHMASTNFQRTVADMKKAGLNPAIGSAPGVGASLTSTNDWEFGNSLIDTIDKYISTTKTPRVAHIRSK